MLLLELRRGEASRVAFVLALIGGWYLVTADPADSDWIGWWTQAAIEPQIFAVIVMGSIMSTVAAWTAGRGYRHRTRAWTDTTPRGGWTQHLVLWAAAWLCCLVAYALFVLIAFLRTASVSEVFEPVWTPVLLGAGMLGLQTAVGVAVGALVPVRLTAPLVGAAWYGLFVALAFFPHLPLVKLFPAIDEHWDQFLRPLDSRLLLATVWCLAAAVAVLALPAALRRPLVAPRAYAAVPAALLALAAGGTLLTRPLGLDSFWAAERAQPARPLCTTSGRTTACMWPDDRHLLTQVENAVAYVDKVTGPFRDFQHRYYQRGLGPSHGPGVELQVNSPQIRTDALISDMLYGAVEPGPNCGDDPVTMREAGGYPDTHFVEAVLHRRAKIVGTEYGDQFSAAVDRFVKAPRAEQDAWLNAAARQIRACRPVPPLPR
ncbi:hypothetical protein [Streptomyces sp. NPDC003077]|uniref:hypothetical protein n=1 Tax=Streptomyces sp. NPDC003077 TaxID=3154443 RepID=UPI00339E05D5